MICNFCHDTKHYHLVRLYDVCEQMGDEKNHQPENPSNMAHVNESANNLSSSDKAIFQLLKTLQDKVEALTSTSNNSYTPTANSQVRESKSGPNPAIGQSYKR